MKMLLAVCKDVTGIVWRCDCQLMRVLLCGYVIVSVWGCYDKCVKMWLSVCEGVIVLGCDCE